MKINVLNYGFIRLIDFMGNDLSIVRSARVSYAADWRTGDDEGSDTKLINYLMRNGHNTPFEAVTFTFEVKAPIFVLRQWIRHRTMSYNEISARYTELPAEFYIPEMDQITEQSTDNKQMRTDKVHNDAEGFRLVMIQHNRAAFSKYKAMLDSGCPRELARSILPLATYSRMFCTVNLHNAFRFIRERSHQHAQYEIRVYADAMLELIEGVCPVAVEAFKNGTV